MVQKEQNSQICCKISSENQTDHFAKKNDLKTRIPSRLFLTTLCNLCTLNCFLMVVYNNVFRLNDRVNSTMNAYHIQSLILCLNRIRFLSKSKLMLTSQSSFNLSQLYEAEGIVSPRFRNLQLKISNYYYSLHFYGSQMQQSRFKMKVPAVAN